MSDADFFRPLTASEAMWATLNHSSSPLALVARLQGALDRAHLQAALSGTRPAHPYLRACVDGARKGIGRSPLEQLPLTFESMRAFGGDEAARAAEVRGAVRRELLAGARISESFVRAHLLSEEGADLHHLVLIGDHVALDARSFFSWLMDVMAGLDGREPQRPDDPEANTLLDWQTRFPESLALRDVSAVATGRPIAAVPAAPSEGASPVMVEDLVYAVPEATFESLKRSAKQRGLTLNGPLFAAFARAAADIAARRGEAMPFRAAAACAVDLRPRLKPPLPPSFISSVAGLANFGVDVGADGPDLWQVAAAASESLAEALAADEAFRIPATTRAGDYAALGALFAVTCIWSNIGHYPGGTVAGGVALQQLEFHVMGEGSNPMVSVHLVEVAGRLVVSLSYSPAFHRKDDMAFLLGRFAHHLGALAGTQPEGSCVCEVE